MDIRDLVAKALVGADFASYFAKPSSDLDAPEPVVVVGGAFVRASRIDGEERGAAPVRVLVVRETDGAAQAAAEEIERFLRHEDWERNAEGDGWRVVGMDTAVPRFKERDSSGRYVWQVDVSVTAVREI